MHFAGTFDDPHTLRFELAYGHPRQTVWRAITDAEQASQWFMLVPLDARVGGEVTFRSVSRDEDTGVRGTITAFAAPSVLEYEFEEVFESTLRFEITAAGEGCRMTFTQRFRSHKVWTHEPDGTERTIGPEAAPGWQDFLVESLGAYLECRPLPTPDEVTARKLVRTEQCRAALERQFG